MRVAHEDLLFLRERRVKKSKQHNEYEFDKRRKTHSKVYKTFNVNQEPNKKLLATVQEKNKYVVDISTLKQALNHGLRLKKAHSVIEFNQAHWLKPYIDMNTELRKVANDFEKNFFKPMNNAVFGKMMENIRKRREIKLIVTEERRKKLVSEPN